VNGSLIQIVGQLLNSDECGDGKDGGKDQKDHCENAEKFHRRCEGFAKVGLEHTWTCGTTAADVRRRSPFREGFAFFGKHPREMTADAAWD
jgi:hypothetical protein